MVITTNDTVLRIQNNNDDISLSRSQIIGLREQRGLIMLMHTGDKQGNLRLELPLTFNGVSITNFNNLLAAIVDFSNSGSRIVLLATTDDISFVIPAGYELDFILFKNTTANTATLDLGTTVGGSEVFLNASVPNNTVNSGLSIHSIERTFSMLTDTTLYLNDDTPPSSWNSATVDVYIYLKKL